MSESIEANDDSESESSVSLHRSHSPQRGAESASRDCSEISCRGRSSSTTTATRETQAIHDVRDDQCRDLNQEQGHSEASANATEESTTSILNSRSDDATQGSPDRKGITCDKGFEASCPSSPRYDSSSFDASHQAYRSLDSSFVFPSTYRSTCDSSTSGQQNFSTRASKLRPGPASSSTTIDTNNNKNSATRKEPPSGLKNNNFSESATSSRVLNRNDSRSKVCDCLSQNCSEKEHSNRRHFIESYYNNLTRLPSANAMSTSNISTPMERLSECDEITKRLLSSPIRTLNISGSSKRRSQTVEMDSSRRASLNTNTMVDFVTPSHLNSLGSLFNRNTKYVSDNRDDQHGLNSHRASLSFAGDSLLSKQKQQQQQLLLLQQQQQQQQQGRSLSVCQDDESNTRFRNSTTNHSVNLSRAISLAGDTSSSSRQLMPIIPLFGCDMNALEQFIKFGWILPPPIVSAIDYILAHGIESIGIFRKSGVKSRISTLKKRIETSQDANLEDFNRNNEFSIYDIADLVKMWFRELKPMPLMTEDLIRLISTSIQSCNQADTCSSQQRRGRSNESSLKHATDQEGSSSLKQQIGSMISPTHRALISKAMTFLATISSRSDINQMTSQNLAICLTPSLCATGSDQASILVAQGALKYCIDNYRILF